MHPCFTNWRGCFPDEGCQIEYRSSVILEFQVNNKFFYKYDPNIAWDIPVQKIIHYVSEIQMKLGVLYFYLFNLTALPR